MINLPILHTDGSGFWSTKSKSVTITNFELAYVDDEGVFGELRVYFEVGDWDHHRDGLIYTDNLFIRELKAFLKLHDIPTNDISYSEQGMQGDDYVSLDVGVDFIESWLRSL